MIIKERQITFSKLIFIFSLILISSCRENVVIKKQSLILKDLIIVKSELELKPNLGLVYHQSNPFTGRSMLYYEDGSEAELIEYVDGKRDGFYKKWFTDGQLSFESFYVDGKQENLTKTWWKNGNKRSEAFYVKGLVNGTQRQWYISGEKFKEMNMANGQEEGIQKAWRRNGKIYNNYEAKNGRFFGLKRSSLCYELESEQVQNYKQ